MASLKEIKTRMASVQSTRKITSAMKMVASSKLHHAQNAIENMLPYEAMLEHILKHSSFLRQTLILSSTYNDLLSVSHCSFSPPAVLFAVDSMPMSSSFDAGCG